MEQRMDRSDYQKAVSEAVGREAQAKQLKDSLMTNRYTSQLRFALNDLFTNALSPARFQVYDSGTNAFQGVVGVDVSRSVRGNMRSARALKWRRRWRVRRRKSKATDAESAAVEWYGKPAKKPEVITGEPVICYVVGGTCFAEIESLNELAEVCGRNVTIGGAKERA